jgi:hypothetical protein
MFDIEKFPSLEKMVSYYQQSPMFFSELNKEVLLTKVLETTLMYNMHATSLATCLST